MSLADELLADLEDAGEEDTEAGDSNIPNDVDDVEDITMEVDNDEDSIRGIAKLRDSEKVFFQNKNSI